MTYNVFSGTLNPTQSIFRVTYERLLWMTPLFSKWLVVIVAMSSSRCEQQM